MGEPKSEMSQSQRSEQDGNLKEISEAQQKRLASKSGSSSIKLCPEYAETLRLKVAKYCESVGGFERMFAIVDVDKSKTIDLGEFRRLLLNMPAEKLFQLDSSVRGDDGIKIKDVTGKTHVMKTGAAEVPVEKMKITKREATALFW